MNPISPFRPKRDELPSDITNEDLHLKERLSGHLPPLDGLRGIAILLVMIVHYQSYLPQSNRAFSWLLKMGQAGWIGVDLFFVLSGFLITGILLRSRNSPRYFSNFYIRRTLRIMPLYYSVLIVSCIFLPLLGVKYEGSDRLVSYQAWLWLYAPNIISSLQGKWIFHNSGANLGHFWSLAVEEHFYLVWPALVYFFPRQLIKICLASIFIALTFRLFLTWINSPTIVPYTLTLCRMDSLSVGALIAIIASRDEGLKTLARWSSLGMILCGSILVPIFLVNKGLWVGNTAMKTFGFLLLAIFFGSLLIKSISLQKSHLLVRILSSRFLVFFGKYSYALYVFHPILEPRIRTIFSVNTVANAVGSNFLGVVLYTTVCIVLTIPFALLSWYIIESPFLKLKSRFSNPTVPSPSKSL